MMAVIELHLYSISQPVCLGLKVGGIGEIFDWCIVHKPVKNNYCVSTNMLKVQLAPLWG